MDTVVEFVPVAATVVDWGALLKNAHVALMRSASAGLDAAGEPAAGVASFVGAVAEFAKPGSDPVDALRSNTLAARHLQFTFLMAFPRRDFWKLQAYDLMVTPADVGDFAIVSATFNDWRNFTISVLTTSEWWNHPTLKLLACKLIAWFELHEFVEAWGSYEKLHDPVLYHLRLKS